MALALALPDEPFVEEMLRYFGPFMSDAPSVAPSGSLRCELVPDFRTELAPEEQVLPPTDWTPEAFVVRGPNFELRVVTSGRDFEARLRQAPGRFPLETAIKMTLSHALAGRGGFFVHGVALAADGRAALFTGQSGAGKSTLAAVGVQGGLELLADELVAVVPDGDGYRVYGTPWNVGTPREAGLAMVGRLVHAATPSLQPAPAADLLRLLLPNTLLINGTAAGRAERFRAVSDLVKKVPVQQLAFAPRPDVAKVLVSALR